MKKTMLATNFATNLTFLVDTTVVLILTSKSSFYLQKASIFNGLQWKENKTFCFNARNTFRKLPFQEFCDFSALRDVLLVSGTMDLIHR
jgi:hypothetical protein